MQNVIAGNYLNKRRCETYTGHAEKNTTLVKNIMPIYTVIIFLFRACAISP